MKYTEFFANIRDNLKDADTDAAAHVLPAALGRATWTGLRKIMQGFPESRVDARGRLATLPSVALTESTAGTDDLPVPPEFEPMLEAYVMEWAHARDARDSKDLDLASYWKNRYDQLAGV